MNDWLPTDLPTAFEWGAVVLALCYVWLAARQNIWCWLCAFISSSVYVWLSLKQELPFYAGLSLYYVLMAIYGWYQWFYNKQQEKQAKKLDWWWHLIAIVILAIVSWLLVNYFGQWFDPKFLTLDVSITVFSVFTTVLVAHKVLENWLYWIVINLATMYLFYMKGMHPTALLHGLYIVFAIYGFINWRKPKHSELVS